MTNPSKVVPLTDRRAFQVETSVPLPGAKSGKGYTEAIRELAKAPIGASVWLPLQYMGGYYPLAKRIGGGTSWITSRAENGGYRVWKIREPSKPAA